MCSCTVSDMSKSGYADKKRQELKEKLKGYFGTVITNIPTGIQARLTKTSADKMGSAKAIEKSKANGFSVDEHFEAAGNIISLYQNAKLTENRPPKEDNPNIVSIKRFLTSMRLASVTDAYVFITVKESKLEGNRIYSVELMDFELAQTKNRLQSGGLGDAAENSGQGN